MLPKMTPVMEAAAARCLEVERQVGKEHLVVISPAGLPVWEATGDEDHVDAQEAHDKGLLVPGCTVIHNHPTNCSLSLDDVLASGFNQSSVYAVCLDGSRFFATNCPKVDSFEDMMLHAFQATTRSIYRHAVGAEWAQDPDIRGISEHILNVVMSSNGNYTYYYHLSPAAKAAAMRAQSLLKGTSLADFDYT